MRNHIWGLSHDKKQVRSMCKAPTIHTVYTNYQDEACSWNVRLFVGLYTLALKDQNFKNY